MPKKLRCKRMGGHYATTEPMLSIGTVWVGVFINGEENGVELSIEDAKTLRKQLKKAIQVLEPVPFAGL